MGILLGEGELLAFVISPTDVLVQVLLNKYVEIGRRWDVLITTSISAVYTKGGMNFSSRLEVFSILEQPALGYGARIWHKDGLLPSL